MRADQIAGKSGRWKLWGRSIQGFISGILLKQRIEGEGLFLRNNDPFQDFSEIGRI